MKKILLILSIAISPSCLLADTTKSNDKFFSLTYSSKVKIKDDDFSMLGVNFGKRGVLTNKIGAYASFDLSTNFNQNGVINMGLVYSASDNLSLLGGAGLFFNNLNDSVFSAANQTNYNLGLLYKFSGKLGLTTSYNTAPKTYNLGMSLFF